MIRDVILKSILTNLKHVFLLVLWITVGCSKSSETIQHEVGEMSEYEAVSHNLLEGSVLQFPLDYPVKDLQKMINRVLPDTLVNDSIYLNDKGDYLVLKVAPIGNMLLSGYRSNLDASLPVKALVYIKKKVALFKIKNKKPIVLKLRLDLHTTLDINESFELNSVCNIQRIRWIEEPKMKIAGIKINLKKTIEKQIEKNRKQIEQAICQAINESVPVQKQVLSLWNLLNQTHRVAQKPIDIWLSMTPKDFSAQFASSVNDTLRVLLYTRAGILISPLKAIKPTSIQPFPINKQFKGEDQVDLKVSLNMPYEYMNLIVNSQLEGQVVEYKGLAAELANFRTHGKDDFLNLDFETKGDIVLALRAKAKPALNEKHELLIEEFDYEVLDESPLANSLEWVTSSSVDSYLKGRSKISLAHILDSLDNRILNAIDHSNLSSKIGVQLSFDSIQSDTTIYYNDRFEWIFSVKGNAHAYLSDNLIVN